VPGKLESIWDGLSACFAANKGPLTKAQVVAWIGTHYSEHEFNANTVASQLYRSCANLPSMVRYKTPKILIHDRRTHTYTLAEGASLAHAILESSSDISSADELDEQADSTFALEGHLRDYLARNLFILEKGLGLWSQDPPSIEYFVAGRRVDILARDFDGIPVVIELKLNKSYDRVVGQALLYQGLVGRDLKCQRVRIILVAAEVSDELKIACSRLADVSLYEYSISMQVTSVDPVVPEEE
jgi:hypothetical protein